MTEPENDAATPDSSTVSRQGFLGSTARPQIGSQRVNLLQLLLADLLR